MEQTALFDARARCEHCGRAGAITWLARWRSFRFAWSGVRRRPAKAIIEVCALCARDFKVVRQKATT